MTKKSMSVAWSEPAVNMRPEYTLVKMQSKEVVFIAYLSLPVRRLKFKD